MPPPSGDVATAVDHTTKGVSIATQLNWTQLTQLNSVQPSQSCFCLWRHELQTESTGSLRSLIGDCRQWTATLLQGISIPRTVAIYQVHWINYSHLRYLPVKFSPPHIHNLCMYLRSTLTADNSPNKNTFILQNDRKPRRRKKEYMIHGGLKSWGDFVWLFTTIKRLD